MLHNHSNAFQHPVAAGQWSSGHAEMAGKAPTVVAVGGSGVSGINIAGSDSAGRVTMSGAAIANAVLFTVTFAAPWAATPSIIVMAVFGGVLCNVTSLGPTGFTVAASGLPANVTSLLVNYICVGMPN